MSKMRTERELDELIALAREYCSLRADYNYARAEGRLTQDQDSAALRTLTRLDEKLELLKSNSELDRRRAHFKSNIVSLNPFKRRIAR